jgi:prepilin-type N-terminal cleavage/methylation domain-containing protein
MIVPDASSRRDVLRSGRSTRKPSRRGFTLTEMVVATALTTLIMMLLGITWMAFGRPAVDVEARARIEQEGILAAQSLACDLGGFLSDSSGRTGSSAQYQFADWNLSDSSVLLINFQGTDSSDIIVVSYQLQGNQLVRSNSATGVSTTIARYVTGFTVGPDQQNPNWAQIQITISYRSFSSTFTLIGVSPS